MAVLELAVAVSNVERCQQTVAVVKVARYYQLVHLAQELVQSRGFVLD